MTIDPHGAASALGLLNQTIATARSLVDLATKAKNHELNTQLSNVLSNVLEVKIKIIELDEENRSLRLQLEQKDSVTPAESSVTFTETAIQSLSARSVGKVKARLPIFQQ
jgi:hypothetical protein